MSRKGLIGSAADAVKSVAGAAIGAAAAAATTVIVESVANSIKGEKKEYQAPAVENTVRHAIAAPVRAKPARGKAAPKRRKRVAKKKPVTRKAAKPAKAPRKKR